MTPSTGPWTGPCSPLHRCRRTHEAHDLASTHCECSSFCLSVRARVVLSVAEPLKTWRCDGFWATLALQYEQKGTNWCQQTPYDKPIGVVLSHLFGDPMHWFFPVSMVLRRSPTSVLRRPRPAAVPQRPCKVVPQVSTVSRVSDLRRGDRPV